MKSSYTDSLAHTTFECKYHIVFAPKFRRMRNENLNASINSIHCNKSYIVG